MAIIISFHQCLNFPQQLDHPVSISPQTMTKTKTKTLTMLVMDINYIVRNLEIKFHDPSHAYCMLIDCYISNPSKHLECSWKYSYGGQ